MALALVNLEGYRDRPLDATLLDSLTRGFAAARAAGIKVVLRFSYNKAFTDDAPLARVLEHIAQLAPVLTDNGDVIAVMQAGFIGAWGEWHGSTHGLEEPAARAAILDALLTALPVTRKIAVRTPMYKDAAFGGGPVGEADAYGTADRARIGHHNDCFLASADDYGTYAAPVEMWSEFVALDGRYTSVGGETCKLNPPRTDCATAQAELEDKHWSYLNRQYHRSVLDGWDTQGCGGDIRRRLGYRFALERVAYTWQVAPGGVLTVELDVANRGYAAPFNERPIYLVLDDGTTRRAALIEGTDARRWAAGEVTRLTARLRVPADADAGVYRLSLWLPDAAPTLRDDPRYAIQCANAGTWDADTGDNLLVDDLMVDPAAPGETDPDAVELVHLP